MMKQLKQVWKVGVILAVVGAWSGARAWAAAPSSSTTVTVSIAPYAEIDIASTATIQYSGNPHELHPTLPKVLSQLEGPLGTNYRFTWIPFTVARNAAITLTLSFQDPFQSGEVKLATGAAITDNPKSGEPQGLDNPNPYVYWKTNGQNLSVSYSKQSAAATVDSYRLYVAAGFGDQVDSQPAGDYTTTFTITVAASLS
ncbi:MAG: hypothetical protein IMX01_06930 [Limnochordaceae bacterium]|nr:hypothetical protein [Limnochordaceae bacterium]